jgi:actin-related protein
VGQTFELPDGQTVRIDDTFPADVASQFFFNPLQLDWGDTELEESVPERLHTAVMESPMDLRRAMWGNTVVAGGNTMFQGFADALYKKLKPLKGCRNVDLKIYAPENRDQTAWKGASVVASMSSFMDTLISQETYEEEGPSVVQQLNIFSFS